MSNHLSPAQALPVDVLRSILKWVVLEERSPFSEDYCRVNYVKELLAVSSAWRQTSLEVLWKKFKLTIPVTTNEVILNCPKWAEHSRLTHNATNLARELYVSIPMFSIIGGFAYKLLVNYFGDTKCLPLANKLTVNVMAFTDQRFDSKDMAIANCLEFAKLLKSMAPAATAVRVLCDGDPQQLIYFDSRYVKTLDEELLMRFATVLYTNTKHASLGLYTLKVKNSLTTEFSPLLSSLIINFVETPDLYPCLVHKSASTLQHLDIGICNANMLISDLNGEAVIYPKLQHLRLYECVLSNHDTNAMTTKTITFPVLRALTLCKSYPFHDDVLFRGNSTTLEYLNIVVDNNTIATLSRGNVLESKYKRLRHVVFTFYGDDTEFSIDSKTSTNKILNHLVGAAKILCVRNYNITRPCIEAAQHGQGFTNIKVFGSTSLTLSLFEVLSLLKTLPALVELRGKINGLGPELESISSNELPDHIVSTYCDIGKGLQVWRITTYKQVKIDYIILLALVCPRLWLIRLLCDAFEDIHVQISDALNSQLYSKYAPQLKRLLDIVCD
ncbi:hypothetical protein GGF41_000991 [Coemansia sp. RSA 2531]|nr:hypothetical protein GGF41_000991 [Coemansia sp. RSA 2531]